MALATLIAALVVLAVLFDWNWLKGPLERRVSAATGREFAIDGDLDVDLGRIVRVRASRVRLGNAKWSVQREMAQVERADIGIALWPLLRGKLAFPALHLERPQLRLERNAAGEANWTFDQRHEATRSRESATLPSLPRVDRLTVEDGEFDLIEPRLKTRLHVSVRSAPRGRQDAAPSLLIDGEGRFRDGDFEVRGRIDSPLQLLERQEPYRIDLRARAGRTLAHARGALRRESHCATCAARHRWHVQGSVISPRGRPARRAHCGRRGAVCDRAACGDSRAARDRAW